jgi:hypothetical protein
LKYETNTQRNISRTQEKMEGIKKESTEKVKEKTFIEEIMKVVKRR